VSKVKWVSRTHFGLTDGTKYKHPFKLSEDWTVEQMQIVWDLIRDFGDTITCTVQGKRKKPCFRPDIGEAEVLMALALCGYKQTGAARTLGISQGVLRHRIKKFGITHPRWYRNKPE
jgi:transcriptional regulator of acetoin/glycerol metabolism